MHQWHNISTPEVMDTFSSIRPIDVAVVAALFTSTGMGPVKDLNSTGGSNGLHLLTYACSVETGTLSPSGMMVRVGALVRLEISVMAQAFRLTVRAVHPTAAKSLFLAIKQQLLHHRPQGIV